MFKKSPALFLLMFVVVGIIIADFFHFSISYLFFGLILSVISSLFFLKSNKEKILIIFMGLSIMLFVSLRFASLYYETGSNHISQFADTKTTFTIYGRVADWPDLKLDRTELVIGIDSLESNSVHYPHGKILLKINVPTTQFQRGDNLVFQGRIYKIEGESFSKEFRYNRFLKYKEISGVVFQNTPLNILHDKANVYAIFPLVDKLRNMIKRSFARNLSPVSSALASGFLIGETRDIDPELYKRFKDSGTLHLLAVSGSNVILVIAFFNFLFRPISLTRKKRFLLLIGVVTLFSMLSYGEPSVLRASLMAGLVLFAGLVEKRYELSNIIAVAALIILLFEPSQLFDIGFQLSFVIAWGLILIVPKFKIMFEKISQKKWYTYLLFPFLISLTAQIFSLGLIGLYFKQIPLLSPIANLFIVPLVSIAVIGVLFLLVADLILPLFGLFVGTIVNLLLEFIVVLVNFFGSDSMLFWSVSDWTIVGVISFYTILFMIPFAVVSKVQRRFIIYAVLIVLNIYAGSKIYASINRLDTMEILFASIPGGNIAIIHTRDHNADIVIQGIQGKEYYIDEKILLPLLKNHQIKSVNNLFILKSDFNAIDDILRLAETFTTDKIYINKKLQNSFLDQIERNKIDGLRDKLTLFQSGTVPELKAGYSYSENSFTFVFNQHKVRFIDKVNPSMYDTIPSNYKEYLVLGRSWNLSMNDYLKIKESGYQKIICSKLAQSISDHNYELLETSTNLIVDLYKSSTYSLEIR